MNTCFDPLILGLSGAVAYINIPSSLVSSIAKATPVLLSIVSFVSSLELQIISWFESVWLNAVSYV